jgi:hypothetical protein
VPVLSGTSSIVLHRDSTTLRSTIRVAADRRVIPSDADEGRGHEFLARLYAQLSVIDDALNVLDNVRLQLPQRATVLEQTAGNSALIMRLRALAEQSADIERALSSQPQNSQDDDFLEDAVRERLLTLLDSASRSTPTLEQVREAHAIALDAEVALERYRNLMTTEIAPLERELERSGAALDLTEKPGPDPKPGPTVDERADRRDE